MLQDMAILTGGQVISEEVGLKLDQVRSRRCSAPRGVVVTKDNTTIVDGARVTTPTSRAASTRSRPRSRSTDSDWDREKLQERLAKLAGGVCVIKVGAHTEVELKEKKHRIEDAVSATRAAIEEGIVAGGGTALVQAAAQGHRRPRPRPVTRPVGVRIVREGRRRAAALDRRERRPQGYVVSPRSATCRAGQGLNAATGEYEDLVKAGVIDPVKVTRSALRNAASIASMVPDHRHARRRQVVCARDGADRATRRGDRRPTSPRVRVACTTKARLHERRDARRLPRDTRSGSCPLVLQVVDRGDVVTRQGAPTAGSSSSTPTDLRMLTMHLRRTEVLRVGTAPRELLDS
jgi:hypothetical protein